MDELKPCPFCGGYAKIHNGTECLGHGDFVEFEVVECTRCFAKSGAIYDRYLPRGKVMKALAIEAWNRRTNE